ncbi:hypothetical protein ACRWDA_26240, partial [Escherichia coli]
LAFESFLSWVSFVSCSSPSPAFSPSTMSTCGNCDCADKSQCVKKGNSFGVEIVETVKSYYDGVGMAGGENNPKCKCGPSCSCTDCTCGD